MEEQLRRLQEEVNNLLEQQAQINKRLAVVQQWLQYFEKQRVNQDVAAGTREITAGETTASGLPEDAAAVLPEPAGGSAAVGSRAATAALAASTAPDLESRIGGIWLNRIGVVAFFLGAAFFIIYAFEQGWINEITRVVLGGFAGLALLALGERTRRRGYASYAQGLTGGGVALLYFSVYAAFSFYGLLNPLPAAALLVAVTALAVALSIYQDAPAIAILGLLSGFLTPLLFAGTEPQYARLFSYLLLLNLGLAAVTYIKRWTFLGVTATVFTVLTLFGLALLAGTGSMQGELSPLGYQLFLSLFLIIFCALPLLLSAAHRKPAGGAGVFILAGGAAAYYTLSWLNLHPSYPDGMGWFTLGLAGFYMLFGLGWRYLFARGTAGSSFTCYSIAAALLFVFFSVQLTGAWITAAWLLQAAALCFLGLRLADRRIRFGFWALLAASLLRLMLYEWSLSTDPAAYRLLINRPALLTLLAVTLLAACARLYYRCRVKPAQELASTQTAEKNAAQSTAPPGRKFFNEINLLSVTAGLLVLTYGGMEISRCYDALIFRTGELSYYQNLSMLGVSIFFGVYAAALAAAGFIWRQSLPRIAAIALFALTVLKVFLIDLSSLILFYRIISLAGLGLLMLAVSYLYQRYRSRISP